MPLNPQGQQNFTGVQYSNPSGSYFSQGASVTQPLGNNPGSNINIGASSSGVNNVTARPIPDLSYADPNTLQRLNISDLIYNADARGYQFRGGNYSGFGSGYGGDPTANRDAQRYYNYIGSLPTRPIGTSALNQFYSSFGGGPTPGPSYNSFLQSTFGNANPFTRNLLNQGGFTPDYRGPFGLGNNNRIGGY